MSPVAEPKSTWESQGNTYCETSCWPKLTLPPLDIILPLTLSPRYTYFLNKEGDKAQVWQWLSNGEPDLTYMQTSMAVEKLREEKEKEKQKLSGSNLFTALEDHKKRYKKKGYM